MLEGNYVLITQEQVLSSVKQQLRIETTDHDIYLMKLINEGVGRLDTLSNFIQQEGCFDVCDGKVKLPCGIHNLVAFRFMDANNRCLQGVYAELPYIKYCGCNVNDWAGYNVYNYKNSAVIVGDCLVFHRQPDFDKVYMAWEGLNLDQNGMWQIYARYETAIVNYVCWRWYLMHENLGMATMYQRDWISQKNWIRSDDQVQQFRKTKRQIAEWMNAWVGQKQWPM